MIRPGTVFSCAGIVLAACGLYAAAGDPDEAGRAVRHGPGVEAHAGIDAVYEKFAESYREQDPEIVANLYAEDAFYLSPGSEILRGRSKIRESFSGMFERARGRKERLSISFVIVARDVQGPLAYDVGIYSVARELPDGSVREDSGKFVVVARRHADGAWLFHVDGYSSIEKE